MEINLWKSSIQKLMKFYYKRLPKNKLSKKPSPNDIKRATERSKASDQKVPE
jgi:hypothetical protein